MSKLCCDCHETKSLETDYYRAGLKCYQKRCKPCHNKTKKKIYINKGSALSNFDKDVIKIMSEELRRGVKLNELSKTYNIKYSRLHNWARKGVLDSENFKYKTAKYKPRK
jgi:hypothetical protein